MGAIQPDPDNRRTYYLTKGVIHQLHQLFSEAKSSGEPINEMPEEALAVVLETVLSKADKCKSLPSQDEMKETIKGLWKFAIHFSCEPLHQPFKLFSVGAGSYQTTCGNRRFISLYMLHGPEHAEEALILKSDPINRATMRYVENQVRDDVPFAAKLNDFARAKEEVKSELGSNCQDTEVCARLGILGM